MKIIIKSLLWYNQIKEIIPIRFTKQGYIYLKDQKKLLDALKRYDGKRIKIKVEEVVANGKV